MATEQKDVEMIEENNSVVENNEPQALADHNKIRLLPEATSEDGTCASFQITDEDHTLGNSLRYMIMKNPEVEFVGYSIPHPTENFLHLRIQTYGQITAVDALHKGLQDLMDLCDVVEEKFTENIKSFKN
ncbi:RNA polymerase subunit AC19 [Hanseniaspora osmophila]|uniref:DNA-directed RNA polymerases I and III subunit RPAC2 n=1 Tax=Hanseniaspora osmophila TaxID=56408 RepID=A0A1E5RN21_9ASCO|nr:DNA-directed RNA polymerases I and III subunit RPAC2 [Hanseniaspora osmophila]